MTYAPVTDPAASPYDTLVRITYLSSSGQAYQASGVMVAADIVLTAGHVVDDSQVASISVTPDQSGSSMPYGSVAATATDWLPDAPLDGLLTQQQSANDIGLIALASPVGERTGWMSLDAGYVGGTVETAGYPALDGGVLEQAQLATQPGTGATLTYPAGTILPGSSGSPLWTELNGQATVVGVVSTMSWAAQLTQADIAFIEQFEAQHPASPVTASTTGASTASTGPTAITLALDAGPVATTVLTNDAAPILGGTGPAGVTLAVSVDGTRIGTTATGATGAWSIGLPVLGTGAHQLAATPLGAAGTASAQMEVYEFASPVAGVSTAGISSLELSTLVGGSASLDFLPGTQAVQLLDGRLELGSGSDAAFLTRLYQGLLGRAPDDAGLSAFDQALSSGASRAEVAADVLGSPEYQASHAGLGDAAFVQGLYQGILGRAADPAGLASWTAALGAGDSRADVTAQIASTPEALAHSAAATGAIWVPDAQAAVVSNLYQFGLDRAPSSADLQFWTGAIRSGLTLPQLAADIAGSSEFTALHGGQGDAGYVTALYAAGFAHAPDAGGLQYWSGALQSGALGRGDVLLGLAQSGEATAGPIRA